MEFNVSFEIQVYFEIIVGEITAKTPDVMRCSFLSRVPAAPQVQGSPVQAHILHYVYYIMLYYSIV